MKEKDFVIAGVIGWVAGPFTFVYLGKKTVVRALVELISILVVSWVVSFYLLVPFVLGYATMGAISARNYNNQLKHAANKKNTN